jgi:hypothetical protein
MRASRAEDVHEDIQFQEMARSLWAGSGIAVCSCRTSLCVQDTLVHMMWCIICPKHHHPMERILKSLLIITVVGHSNALLRGPDSKR